MYKSILVPIDLAHVREGKNTLEIARANLKEGGHVTLLNVVEDIPKWAAAQLPKGTIERSMKNATEQLKAICEKCDGMADFEVRTGHTYQVILEVAQEKNAELIIIASHRPGFREYYLGSTAAKVVRHAACSVHVMR
jgi:nucleotide-binding universal stress UspA family protein